MSLIENSLDKLRRAADGRKTAGVAAVREPVAVLREPGAAHEPRYVHRRTQVNLARLRAEGYVPDAEQARRFADWCHRVKRPIIDSALALGASEELRLILLTSALPGDGKTLIALNLALSMARERDISVLLVDGDLPRAQISRLLGLQQEAGLLHALRDDAVDAETLVHDTDISGLQILPAGGPVDGATELLASARMRNVVAHLSGRNPRRLILFDAPPILVSSEARALVSTPGQVLLVARVGRTPQQAVIDAIAHIAKEKLRGVVLNDAYIVSSGHGYYDYAYGAAIEEPAKPG